MLPDIPSTRPGILEIYGVSVMGLNPVCLMEATYDYIGMPVAVFIVQLAYNVVPDKRIIPIEGTCQVDAGKKASLLLDDLPAKTFRIYKIKK